MPNKQRGQKSQSRLSPKGKKDRKNNNSRRDDDDHEVAREEDDDGIFKMTAVKHELRRLEDVAHEGHRCSSSHSVTAPGTPSRIPLYTANGIRPHHLNSPAHSRSRNSSGCDVGSNLVRLVPPSIQRQHLIHTLENHSHSSHHQTRSVPVSGRTTPTNYSLNSSPATSRRPSFNRQLPSTKPGKRYQKQNNKLTQSGTSSSSSGNGNSLHNQMSSNGHRRDCCHFAEYLPLCELQRGLKRGEVLEGILRINAKNFEDAYISAPGEHQDIYISGVRDRNRAFNGDKVAVVLHPETEWKIWYDRLKTNWDTWQHEFNGEVAVEHEEQYAHSRTRGSSGCDVVQEEVINEGDEVQPDVDQEVRAEAAEVLCSFMATVSIGAVGVTEIEIDQDVGLTASVEPEKETMVVEGSSERKKNKRKRKHSKKNKKDNKVDDEKQDIENNDPEKTEECTESILVNESCPSSKNEEPEPKETQAKSKKQLKREKKEEIEQKRDEKKRQRKQNQLEQLEKKLVQKSKKSVFLSKQSPKAAKSPEKKSIKESRTRLRGYVNGLPREVLALTAGQLLERYSFGKLVVQKTARVVGVTEIHPRVAGGKIVTTTDETVMKFVPSDSRIPRMLLRVHELPPGFIEQYHLVKDGLFMVKMINWPVEARHPFGKLIAHLGNAGEVEAESAAILLENEVQDVDFPYEVEMELQMKYPNFIISPEEYARRRDFTEDCVFTIDPLTARDLDDALSIKPLNEFTADGKQLFEVGVHIADVSHFVEEGTILDQIAQQRSTSYYLVQRVVPMLPRILCEKLCSLTSGQDKLTFSVLWKMDNEGNIHDTWFGKTVIRSCAQFAYEHVQEMIVCHDKGVKWSRPEGPLFPCIHGNWSPNDICGNVLELYRMSKHLRKKRFDNGALKLDKIKFNFVLDKETGLPLGFTPGHQTEANYLVEEFMLLANQFVGQRILEAFPNQAFLRRHPSPDEKQIREMKTFCANYGIEFDSSSASSIQKFMLEMKEKNGMIHQVLSLLLLKAMSQALYFPSGGLDNMASMTHYALNIPVYTHFTSPIRRYPDVIVHRMLNAYLTREQIYLSVDQLKMMSDHCNARKTASRIVSEASQKLFLCLYLKEAKPIETAVVTLVLDRAFDVLILKFGQVIRIYLDQIESISNPKFQSNSGRKRLTFTCGVGKNSVFMTIAVSKTVKVQVDVMENEVTRLKGTLIPINLDGGQN